LQKIAFCWELGANLGHLGLASVIATRVESENIDPTFVVADVVSARKVLGPDARILQAPTWPPHHHEGAALGAASYGDLLTFLGFDQPDRLKAMLSAWLDLLRFLQPTGVVVDHGPTAILASRILGLPTVHVGTGFTMPPLDYAEFPLLRGDLAPAIPESRLAASLTEAFRYYGHRTSEAGFVSCFQTAERLIVGLPELDPYRSFRREPLFAPPGGLPRPVPANALSLFAYVGRDLPNLSDVLQALCALPIPVEIYLRDGDRFTSDFVRMRGKVIHERPADLREVLPRVSHVLSQAGATISAMALAAGRPHLMLPQHYEARLNARLVEQVGGGWEVPARAVFAEELDAFLDNPGVRVGALTTARVLESRPLAEAGEALLGRIRKLGPASAGRSAASVGADST